MILRCCASSSCSSSGSTNSSPAPLLLPSAGAAAPRPASCCCVKPQLLSADAASCAGVLLGPLRADWGRCLHRKAVATRCHVSQNQTLASIDTRELPAPCTAHCTIIAGRRTAGAGGSRPDKSGGSIQPHNTAFYLLAVLSITNTHLLLLAPLPAGAAAAAAPRPSTGRNTVLLLLLPAPSLTRAGSSTPGLPYSGSSGHSLNSFNRP